MSTGTLSPTVALVVRLVVASVLIQELAGFELGRFGRTRC